ncbi:MAG TPA: hypothetical protein VK427_17280, partial [Kofleriaceae bacterium]|nr:hypothetical protein [Kofleriaceae bacterium]
MSTRIIAAVYNDAIRARRVITPALEPFSVAERGRWLEMRPTRGRRGFRVAFLRDLPFSTFPSLRAHVGSELRERLAAAAATEEGLVFALLAYEDQSLQRHLWAVSGVTEIERSIDDRDRARRVWIEGGRRKTQKATIDVDPAQFGTGDAFDDDAYDAAVRTAEAPFCAIQWLEDETAITLDALIGAWLDADDGEDVAAGGSAPPDGPFSAYERLQLRARSAKVRADAVLGLQRHPPSAALFDVLTAALRDPDADVRRMGACVAFLLRPDEATRATPQARTFSDAMSGLRHALSETVMDDESGRTHAT